MYTFFANKLSLKKCCQLCFLTLLLSPFMLQANESTKADLAEIWLIEINYEDAAGFEQAFKDYRKHRQELGDSRAWEIYKSQVSSDRDSYLLRHCCFKKAQRKNFQQWLDDNEIHRNWNEALEQYATKQQHFYSGVKPENFNFPIVIETEQYVAVREFNLKVGSSVDQAMDKLQADVETLDWGEHWAWDDAFGGKSLVNLDFSFEKFSDELAANNALPVDDLASDALQALSFEYDSPIRDNRYDLYLFEAELSR